MISVQVAIALPLRGAFTYSVPKGLDVRLGSRVLVPLGRRCVVGYVVGECASAEASKYAGQKEIVIKDILEVLDTEPTLSEKMVELIKWLSNYYFVPIGEMCKTALPNALAVRTKKKREITPRETVIDDIFMDEAKVTLSAEQNGAVEDLKGRLKAQKFETTLLHGVTGSGKTEIYLRLFEEVIKVGRSAILLVPEIGMTPQTVGRIIARFGDCVATYHSGLTEAKRFYEWKRIKDGKAKIVIGTRSAVFAPLRNLGLIVVDEEHDPSYKQDENPRYNGRDTAVMRAKMENVPCILGSATPSIETFTNAKLKKYHYIHLQERPTGAPLPEVEIIDMRLSAKGASISPKLMGAISDVLNRKEQTILFLNRRGFASFVLCEECGEAFTCPNCNITLSYHKENDSLLCHYCEYKIKRANKCLKCGSPRLKDLGTGTERIESELRSLFPDARIERFDRDVAVKAGMRSKILSQMRSGKIDILIGTQMVTKGHDFPNVTLVGVLDADHSINFPDFRSGERTFQLLTQVAGRSGRSDKKGKVIIQTYSPEHYSIAASMGHDFFNFYENEIPLRRELCYPPFGRLAMVKVQGLNDAKVMGFAQYLAMSLRGQSPKQSPESDRTHEIASSSQGARLAMTGVTILGPTPALIHKIRNNYRWQLMLKGSDIKGLKAGLINILDHLKETPRGVKVSIDVDPINML